jgi:hypothetical protein
LGAGTTKTDRFEPTSSTPRVSFQGRDAAAGIGQKRKLVCDCFRSIQGVARRPDRQLERCHPSLTSLTNRFRGVRSAPAARNDATEKPCDELRCLGFALAM